MRHFSIITEADARRLEPGSTVVLGPGGHITPLARDTLRDLRVTVVDGRTPDDAAALVPAAEVKSVAIGSDHSGLALKATLVAALRGRGLAVNDLGTHTKDPVDYPDIASAVAVAVARGEAQAGIVIDGAGIGSAMVANKVPGVRAAMCPTPTIARYSREHNGANVVTLGASLLSPYDALAIVDVWLTTPMTEPRYIARLAKIRLVEDRAKSEWP
ncbi:MAG: RpiB/LacA/LacB family sugar-phosphate isomerase [Acidobacteria bacterium]|nr:RpiB/LacA/LacB family sugar-phosphate isomerase [Acidobacteriota bacterium]